MTERSEGMPDERPLGIGADRRPPGNLRSPSPICIDRTAMGSGGAAPEHQ
jgi:hypothetical protein